MSSKRKDWPACTYCTNGQPHPGCTGHVSPRQPRAGQHCMSPCQPGEVCRFHGGAAPQAKAGRARRQAEKDARAVMVALGVPITDTNPTQALLDLIHAKAGEVAWLRAKVRQVTDDEQLVWGRTAEVDKRAGEFPGVDTTHEAKPNIWWAMLRTAEDQLANYCTRALAAGIEERRVRLAESQGALVADAIRRILDALHLSPAQLQLVPTVVPAVLRALDGGAS